MEIRIQQLEARINPSYTATPRNINGEYDTTSPYSNARIPRNSTPVTSVHQIPYERLREATFQPITCTDNPTSPIPRPTTPQNSYIPLTEKRHHYTSADDSDSKRHKRADVSGTITPPSELLRDESPNLNLPPIHRPEFSLPPFNGEALQFEAFITNFRTFIYCNPQLTFIDKINYIQVSLTKNIRIYVE